MMLACRRLLAIKPATASIHTVATLSVAGEGFFGKLNPWATKKTEESTPAEHTDPTTPVTFNVKYEEQKEAISWKKTSVTDKEEVEKTLKSIVLQLEGATETNWQQLPLNDIDTKFKLLKESMKELGREIPNYQLNQLETTQDVLDYFQTEESPKQSNIEVFFEENADSLPKNITFIPRE